MKIHINDQGDRSVGISPNEMTVELNYDLNSLHDREEMRKIFMDFAVNTLDFCYGRVDIHFDDECPDCLSIEKDGKCIHPDCVNNIYKDEEEESLMSAVSNKNKDATDRIEEASESGKIIRII